MTDTEAEEKYLATLAYFEKELWPEHKEQAVDEFIEKRLRSYYLNNNKIAVDAMAFINKANELKNTEPTSSLLYSAIATEVILKSVLLIPVVSGLVITEHLAVLISDMLVKQSGIDRFKKLIFSILEQHIRFENGLEKFKRKGGNITLWEERAKIQKVRNKIMHQAKYCTSEEADTSYKVALAFFHLTHLLIKNIGFEFNDNYIITEVD